MRVELLPATAEHAARIASNPRPADVDEMRAAANVTVADAMRIGMRVSPAVSGVVDGEAVCMFGITPHNLMLGQGVPWLVGSQSMDALAVKRELLRQSRAFMREAATRYELLFNAVDDRNEAAKRWLSWLGFTLLEPTNIGVNGEPFRPFYWRA